MAGTKRDALLASAEKSLQKGKVDSALKDYLSKRKGTVDELVEAARADRIYAFMRPYLEALA